MNVVKWKAGLLRSMAGKDGVSADASAVNGATRVSATAGDVNAPRVPKRMLRSRAWRAGWFGFKMIVGFVWWEMVLVRIIGRERVERGRLDRIVKLARNFRGLAIRLGGVWIKLGQFLSSRVDIFPPPVIAALADLQDAVPPEDSAVIVAQIERELGKPIGDAFAEFDREPVAAASFGQAHRALLHDEAASAAAGAPTFVRVIVKAQRPFMDDIVAVDLVSLRRIMRWLKRYEPIRRRANLDALQREFAETVFEELDYVQEARNAEQFAANFADDAGVLVPKPFASLTTKRVLVLEDVEGIKTTDHDALAQAGVSRKAVAKKLFDTYLKQIFIDGYFHADPHPGNLFVEPVQQTPAADSSAAPSDTPFKLTYIDFGMMGRIKPEFKNELKEIIIGVSLRDVHRLTMAAQHMGFFLPGTDTLRIEQAIAALFDKVWGMSNTDLASADFDDMYDFALQFRDLMSSLPFQMPQNVLYLGRAVNILSGMSTALDPDFNPWTALQPFAAKLASKEGAQTTQDVLKEVLRIARLSVQLPVAADQVLSRALSGQLELRAQLSTQSTQDLRRIETGLTRVMWALVFVATLVCGTILAVSNLGVVATVCFVLSVIAFLRMIF